MSDEAVAEAPAETKVKAPELDVLVASADVATEMPTCKRTGMCCRFVLLEVSPRELRARYHQWERSTWDKRCDGDFIPEMHLVYPMLAGRCRGKWTNPKEGCVKYVYGPCAHLKEAEEPGDTPACLIHHIKPRICHGFPFYSQGRELQMRAHGDRPQPSYIKGCGFNTDPDAGFGPEDFKKLEPLTDEEKDEC